MLHGAVQCAGFLMEALAMSVIISLVAIDDTIPGDVTAGDTPLAMLVTGLVLALALSAYDVALKFYLKKGGFRAAVAASPRDV